MIGPTTGGRTADTPLPEPIAAVDVGYPDAGGALAACVVAGWSDSAPIATRTVRVDVAGEYRPGAFFERELSPLLAVLGAGPLPALVVIDGYVWLDGAGRAGLGAHLHEAIGLPVVGVAKTAFRGSAHAVAVRRGTSARPLFVTAAGIDPVAAAEAVASMHGAFRVPTLIKLADHLSRGRSCASTGGPGRA